MKKYELIPLKIMMLIVFGILFCASCTAPEQVNVKANNIDTAFHYDYVNGQVLYPEYSGSDTLVVTNAKGLNEAMQKILDNKEMGDDQYDSLFNRYCKVDNTIK